MSFQASSSHNLVMITIASISDNKYNFTPLWMAFSKNSYLHPSPGFGVWLNISVYIMQTVPSRLAWRDRFKTSRPTSLHGLEVRTAGTQFKLTTILTKHLFPEERSLRKLQSKQRRQKNNFSTFFWGGFFTLAKISEVKRTGWCVLCPTWF